MTFVRVLSARRVAGDNGALAVADVELDAALTVRGVEILDDPIRGSVAVAPRRPWGDHERVLAWSDRVSADIVASVRHALGDRAAISGDEAELELASRGPEGEIPSSELPVAPDEDDLLGTVSASPGVSVSELAELIGVHRVTASRQVRDAIAAGRLRAEPDGARRRLFPVEIAS